jgi:hypothetical protein
MSRWMKSALFAVVLAAGCYSPQLGTPGFYCHPEDEPACPDGQECVDGRCVSPDMKTNRGDGGVLQNGSCGMTGNDCQHDKDCCGGYCDLTMKKCL